MTRNTVIDSASAQPGAVVVAESSIGTDPGLAAPELIGIRTVSNAAPAGKVIDSLTGVNVSLADAGSEAG